MTKSTKSGDSAQGAEPKVNKKKIATSINEVEQAVEQNCPISYDVILYQDQVGDGDNPPRRAGIRTKTFCDPNPFLARQEAFIYARGLEFITNEQHKWGGLIFDSPEQAKAKGYRNYNSYGLEIWLNNELDPDGSLPVDGVELHDGNRIVCDLDTEIHLLESLGYFTSQIIAFKVDDDEVYRAINSHLNLVDFKEPDPKVELFDCAA